MQETTLVAKTLDEAFDKIKVKMQPGHTSGRKYYICPKCSHERHGYNRSSRCLGINVDNLGIRGFCNHCTQEYVVMLEDQIRSNSSAPSNGTRGPGVGDRYQQQPKQNGYASLHRAGRAQWSRRR